MNIELKIIHWSKTKSRRVLQDSNLKLTALIRHMNAYEPNEFCLYKMLNLIVVYFQRGAHSEFEQNWRERQLNEKSYTENEKLARCSIYRYSETKSVIFYHLNRFVYPESVISVIYWPRIMETDLTRCKPTRITRINRNRQHENLWPNPSKIQFNFQEAEVNKSIIYVLFASLFIEVF